MERAAATGGRGTTVTWRPARRSALEILAGSTRWPFTTRSVRRPFLSRVMTTTPGGACSGPASLVSAPGKRSGPVTAMSVFFHMRAEAGGAISGELLPAAGAGAASAFFARCFVVSCSSTSLLFLLLGINDSGSRAANGPARAMLPPSRPSPPSTSAPASKPSASVGGAGRRSTRRRTRPSRAPRRPTAASASRGAAGTTALWLHSASAVRARARRSGSPPTRAVAVSSQQFSRSVRTQLAINHTAGW